MDISQNKSGVSQNGTIYMAAYTHLLFIFAAVKRNQGKEEFIIGYHQLETEQTHPVLVAAYLHDELVRIHPFVDGNGRTSRLLMNLYLLRKGYTLVNIKGSNDAKLEYYKAQEVSHVEKQPVAFQTLVTKAEKESLLRHLAILGGDFR